MAYASLILTVNSHPEWNISKINNYFLAAGVVHLINALMYIWVWLDAGLYTNDDVIGGWMCLIIELRGYSLCYLCMVLDFLGVT